MKVKLTKLAVGDIFKNNNFEFITTYVGRHGITAIMLLSGRSYSFSFSSNNPVMFIKSTDLTTIEAIQNAYPELFI